MLTCLLATIYYQKQSVQTKWFNGERLPCFRDSEKEVGSTTRTKVGHLECRLAHNGDDLHCLLRLTERDWTHLERSPMILCGGAICAWASFPRIFPELSLPYAIFLYVYRHESYSRQTSCNTTACGPKKFNCFNKYRFHEKQGRRDWMYSYQEHSLALKKKRQTTKCFVQLKNSRMNQRM